MMDVTLKWMDRPIPPPRYVVPAKMTLHVHVRIDVPEIDGVAGLQIGTKLCETRFDSPVTRVELFGQISGWDDCDCDQWNCPANGILPIPCRREREFAVVVNADAALDKFIAHVARIRETIIAAHAVAVKWSERQTQRTLTLDPPKEIVPITHGRRIRTAVQSQAANG